VSGALHPDGEVVWRVVPLATPRVLRPCARCAAIRPFVSTDKFRINAQQRRLDVWLLYACVECESTWKREILARCAPEEIAPDLYRRFLANDLDTAWRCAFAPGERLASDGAVRVERGGGNAPPRRIRLRVPYPCPVRLDRLLAQELGLSRSALQRAVQSGALTIDPGAARALRRDVRDGTLLVLECAGLRRSGSRAPPPRSAARRASRQRSRRASPLLRVHPRDPCHPCPPEARRAADRHSPEPPPLSTAMSKCSTSSRLPSLV